MKFLKVFASLLALVLVGAVLWLVVAPPELLRVGDGYAAKIVCSSVFITGRDPDEVLKVDVQAPGHPLLRLVRISVDRDKKTVAARMFGFAAPGYAAYRDRLGCASVPDGDFARVQTMPSPLPVAQVDSAALWPDGEATAASANAQVQALLADPDLTGPGMRAVAVVKDGKLIAEAYGEGFDAASPLLGWSMTKTVNAALIGMRIRAGEMGLNADHLLGTWTDARAAIKLSDLMAMQSGLEFNENYGTVADVTRMLYLETDMADYAASQPALAEPGTVFTYSSGTATLLSRLWMNTFDDPAEALAYPQQALFGPLGMASAVLETDAQGTFVGSSYMYATARDWARFALFLLQDGVWKGQPLLPDGFVAFMRTPSKASGGVYGSGQVWTQRPGDGNAGLPEDTFWMSGHDGQTVMLVPSKGLAVIRLGLTPRALGYQPERLGQRIIDILKT
ncbi:MAG: serine hydrolase [Pararhizobium sp.]|nr:serine hydrolase [Pararhizobium sp.]MDO9414582.1 serine hydrolase [Pararhizobium sp.]